jgi:hypothetical protein
MCFGQNKYNDWFDLNLKGKPKSVKEVSLTSFTDFLTRELNASLHSNLEIDEYYFDTLGLISKKFSKDYYETNGYWLDYSKIDILNFQDSIILIDSVSDRHEDWRERKYLDKNQFLKRRVSEIPMFPQTFIYQRDEFNRIIEVDRDSYHIDSGVKIKTIYELNANGDIVCEKNHIEWFYKKSSFEDKITTYQYVYDTKNNWIIRISITDNGISKITQREIKYE